MNRTNQIRSDREVLLGVLGHIKIKVGFPEYEGRWREKKKEKKAAT
jgi:hypothetical protein